MVWGGKVYAYDDEGNLTSDGTIAYNWDDRNRLKSIEAGGAEIASFQYDNSGRRTGKTIRSVTTGFLYDGVNVAQELQGTSNTAAVKAHLLTAGIDETLLRMEGNDGASRHSVVSDANNNTVMLLDVAESSVASYSYEPYGLTAADAGSANTQQYTGRENDNPGTDQGLYYYRARYYMPGNARFMSEDPIGWFSGQTNNDAYVGGDPIGFRDPSGLDATGDGGPDPHPDGIDPDPDFNKLKKRCYDKCDIDLTGCLLVCGSLPPFWFDKINQCIKKCRETDYPKCRGDCARQFPDRPLWLSGQGRPGCEC